jgi:cob(I)alamin adenosyltransferase
MPLGQGYIQIYMGEGKGKTTAALGLALRAAGHKLKVYMVQFLKSVPSGELCAAEKLAPYFTIFRFEKEHDFFTRLTAEEKLEVKAGVREAFDFVRKAVADRECDILILDEIFAAIQYQLLEEAELLDLLNQKPAGMELVLTGRHASDRIIGAADLVTCMHPVKHYYAQGVLSRPGIEK